MTPPRRNGGATAKQSLLSGATQWGTSEDKKELQEEGENSQLSCTQEFATQQTAELEADKEQEPEARAGVLEEAEELER